MEIPSWLLPYISSACNVHDLVPVLLYNIVWYFESIVEPSLCFVADSAQFMPAQVYCQLYTSHHHQDSQPPQLPWKSHKTTLEMSTTAYCTVQCTLYTQAPPPSQALGTGEGALCLGPPPLVRQNQPPYPRQLTHETTVLHTVYTLLHANDNLHRERFKRKRRKRNKLEINSQSVGQVYFKKYTCCWS